MRKNGNRAVILLMALLLAFTMLPQMTAEASYPHTPNDGHVHNYGEWRVTNQPSCTSDGKREHTCTQCGWVGYETLHPLGHKFGAWNTTTPATCFAAGVETRFCSVCGASETQSTAQLKHVFGPYSVTTAPTCTATGVETRRCTLCGTAETQAVAALGHDYGPWVTTVAATCTTDGAQTQTCSRCGDVKTQLLPKLGHKFGAWTVNKEATCTAAGERQRTCPVDSVVEKETIPALGHKFGAWTVNKAATCTAAGEEQRVCPVDNVVEKRAIPALGHKFGAWTQTKAPTCDAKGEEQRTCSVDNVVEKRDIARLKHVPSKMWYALRKPTLTEPGIKYRVCEICGKRLDSVEYAPEGYRYGLIALNFGPYVKDLKPQELATFVDRFTPLDLSQDGETQWPIITQDGYYIGMLKMNVFQGDLTVSYVMNDPVTVVTHEILFLHEDGMAVTAGDLNNVIETLKFNEPIPLMGLEERVLNVRLSVNYDQENAANRPFSDTGLYLDGVTQNALLLQDMTDKLMQGPLGD